MDTWSSVKTLLNKIIHFHFDLSTDDPFFNKTNTFRTVVRHGFEMLYFQKSNNYHKANTEHMDDKYDSVIFQDTKNPFCY